MAAREMAPGMDRKVSLSGSASRKKWIAFVELADWCAQSTTAAGIDEEEKARDLALRRLADSILKGEFEIEARSKPGPSFFTWTRS
jgi:hypothetical protein